MKLHKRILNQDWAQALVSWLAASYLRFVRATGRWDVRDWDNVQKLLDDGKPIVLCYWHGRLVANAFGWPSDKPLYQLSTQHRDGKLAGKTYQRLGVMPVWLDKNSPMEATRKLVKILKGGGVGSITPDGPKGPRQRMQMGAINIARLSGASIVPMTNSTNRAKVLGTWDRMLLPLPFARGAYVMGAPVEVPRTATDEELEALRQGIEDTLNDMTRALDAEFGQDTPEPHDVGGDAP